MPSTTAKQRKLVGKLRREIPFRTVRSKSARHRWWSTPIDRRQTASSFSSPSGRGTKKRQLHVVMVHGISHTKKMERPLKIKSVFTDPYLNPPPIRRKTGTGNDRLYIHLYLQQ